MTEIEADREMTRTEVADYLREFARQLDTSVPVAESPPEGDADDGRVTFMVGNDSATINPPETVGFEVEVETDASLIGDEVEHEVQFEIRWQTAESDEEDYEEEIEVR